MKTCGIEIFGRERNANLYLAAQQAQNTFAIPTMPAESKADRPNVPAFASRVHIKTTRSGSKREAVLAAKR